jgi:hypothetical protein
MTRRRARLMDKRNLTVACASMVAVAAVLAGSASAGPPAISPVSVEIKSTFLSGTRPDGSAVDFTLKFTAQGDSASLLTGEGRHTGSGGVIANWSATGSISGDIVTLSGVVTSINNPDYAGSPGAVVANAATGAITFYFGPLTGGRFVGQTIVGEGFGMVRIRQ